MANYFNEVDTKRLDAQRKKILLYTVLSVVPVPATFTVVFLLIALGYGDKIPGCVVLFFIAAFALMIVFSTISKRDKILFYRDYKDSLVNKVLNSNFDNYNYQPEQGIPLNEIELLVSRRSFTYEGEDLITGVYKGVQYRQSDVNAYYYTGSGRNRRKVVLMHGRLASFQYPKCRNAVVVVTKKNMNHIDTYGLERIQMESTEFNNNYHIYSNNEQMAFYLLTPQVMEYIQRLGRHCSLYIRFHNGVVYVLRNKIDGVFEVKLTKKVDLNLEARNVVNDMMELLEVIDILKLDKV